MARVVEEVTGLVRKHRLDEVALVDSNFLVDMHRAVEIARGFLVPVSGLVDFPGIHRPDLQNMSDERCPSGSERRGTLDSARNAGFAEVLKWMNKRHLYIPDIGEAARKCARAGIRVTLNLIFGYPGEEERHRRETLRVMSDIAARFDNVTFSPNVFVPYPGIPIWKELQMRGLAEPETLAAWADIDLGVAISAVAARPGV